MRRGLRLLLLMAVLGVATVVALATLATIERGHNLRLPAPTGPFAVGRAIDEWRDERHADPFDPRATRELVVWIWYPAERTATAKAADYLPSYWRDALARYRHGPLQWLTRDPARVYPHSL